MLRKAAKSCEKSRKVAKSCEKSRKVAKSGKNLCYSIYNKKNLAKFSINFLLKLYFNFYKSYHVGRFWTHLDLGHHQHQHQREHSEDEEIHLSLLQVYQSNITNNIAIANEFCHNCPRAIWRIRNEVKIHDLQSDLSNLSFVNNLVQVT